MIFICNCIIQLPLKNDENINVISRDSKMPVNCPLQFYINNYFVKQKEKKILLPIIRYTVIKNFLTMSLVSSKSQKCQWIFCRRFNNITVDQFNLNIQIENYEEDYKYYD